MITKGFQIILIVAMSINLIVTIRLIKKENMRVKYALSWILISLSMLFLAIFPGTLRVISDQMYVYNDANMLFLIAIGILFVMAFSFSVLFSKNSYMIQDLAQENAILRLKLEKMENKLEEMSKDNDTDSK